MFKASDRFYEKYNTYPGTKTDFENDVGILKGYCEECLQDLGSNLPIDKTLLGEDYIYEFCRYGNSYIPCIVSIIGSMASQEIIKMITYQFDTVNNTIIYDGINVTLSTFKI